MPLRTNAAALLQDDPFLPGRQTTRTTVEGPIGTTTTITETPNAAALVEQVLGRGGLVLVRLAVVAGTAFLAGAVAQRILLASFAIRVAGMEIPEVAQASTATLEQVRTRIDGLSKAINDATSAGERLIERVDLLEFKISHLTERDRPPPLPPIVMDRFGLAVSDPSDLAKEFARIRERNKRQQKEFDEAMEPLLERLRSLAAPAKRIRTKKRRRDANTSTS